MNGYVAGVGSLNARLASFIADASATSAALTFIRLSFRMLARSSISVMSRSFVRHAKDARLARILRELLEMAYEAYVQGDRKLGAHILQECEGQIWPSRQARAKYIVEAERRAFGEVALFADVRVSPFPYEGTEHDMGPGQKPLFDYTEKRVLDYFKQSRDFRYMAFVLEAHGTVREIKQRSIKQALAEIKQCAVNQTITACITSELVMSGLGGVVVYNIEEISRPHVSVRS